MASQSEKTHAKNLENLRVANSIIATLENYNPNNPLITKTALAEFETGLSLRMQKLNETVTAQETAVGAQMTVFKPVSTRITKIMKSARAQAIAPETVEHLQTTANRLRGVRVTPKTPDNPATLEIDESKSNHSSSSRRSYAGILESLDLLDEQIKAAPGYQPNEVEYKSATISSWINDLRNAHNAAITAKAATTAARAARDAFAYNETDGLLVRMNALKNYVETILDKNDPRLRQLKGLRFVDFSK